MALTFIGIDPETGGGNCPAVWVDTTPVEPDLIFQGYVADAATLAECEQKSPRPDNEAVIRVPARMVPLIREACNAAERAQLRSTA
ncbi:hypothetical protein [Streptomyces beijiangensis]|uniref:Uncharacterized protein n=1 Tax=Streptomyces beijiangensis TaxID=163361 RepID=A0A939JDW0_9ACTN|nr:hypothetical protein [Streptomyces beijiangensis]MBO0512431.1 hypothetical protein [Streptomyces beijiangensis]